VSGTFPSSTRGEEVWSGNAKYPEGGNLIDNAPWHQRQTNR